MRLIIKQNDPATYGNAAMRHFERAMFQQKKVRPPWPTRSLQTFEAALLRSHRLWCPVLLYSRSFSINFYFFGKKSGVMVDGINLTPRERISDSFLGALCVRL